MPPQQGVAEPDNMVGGVAGGGQPKVALAEDGVPGAMDTSPERWLERGGRQLVDATSPCQQVKRTGNKKYPQITLITRIFVPKFLFICENPRNLRTFLFLFS
jgi:hypothetical protein